MARAYAPRLLLVAMIVSALSSCATATRGSERTVALPPGISPPQVVYKVDPEYPAALRREGVTGTVTIQATIDKDGRLLQPSVLRSADPRLNELALAAVQKWRFKPGTLNGEPAEVLYQVDVKFSIP